MVMLCILQNNCLDKSCIFFEHTLPRKTSGSHASRVQSVCVALVSLRYFHLRSSHGRLFGVTDCRKLRFNENPSIVSNVIKKRQTHRHGDTMNVYFVIKVRNLC